MVRVRYFPLTVEVPGTIPEARITIGSQKRPSEARIIHCTERMEIRRDLEGIPIKVG